MSEEKKPLIATQLTAESIHLIDSKFTLNLNRLIQQAVRDCLEEPKNLKARTLTIKLQLQPNADDPRDIDVTGSVKPAMPAREFEKVTGQANARNESIKFTHRQGELFSDYDPDEIDDEPPHDGKAAAAGE